MKKELSIILPVFNNQDVSKCIDSLLAQKVDSFEIICIDDGSDDGCTPQILDDYQIKHPNIFRVFHIENSGVWNARKYGIRQATGSYIGFCDCDDLVSEDMYILLLQKIQQQEADMAVCGFSRIDESTNKIYSTEMVSWKKNVTLPKDIAELLVVNTSLWNKIFKRELLDNVIELKQPPRIGEDMMFLMSIYPFVNKITFVNQSLYSYYVRSGSSMNTVTYKDCENTVYAYQQVAELIYDNTTLEAWKELVALVAFIHLGISLPVTVMNDGNLLRKVTHYTKSIINQNYNCYRNSSLLKLRQLKKANKGLIKVKIIQIVYRFNLFPIFITMYRFLITKCKKDIKW